MKVLVEIDNAGNISVPTKSGVTYLAGIIPADVMPVEYEEQANADLKELVAAGMSADDLIKLKHGGVI